MLGGLKTKMEFATCRQARGNHELGLAGICKS